METQEVIAPTNEVNVEQLLAELSEAKERIAQLNNKKDELLTETKKAKKEREEAAQLAQQVELEKAQKNGDYEKLLKAEQTRSKEYLDQLGKFKQSIRNEKLDNIAMKVAVDLAKGDATRAELLAEFVKQSLNSLADEEGKVGDDVLTSIKKNFESDKKYAPLIGSSAATGGGATGNTSGAKVNAKIIDRQAFEVMDSTQKMEYCKSGGKIIDKI